MHWSESQRQLQVVEQQGNITNPTPCAWDPDDRIDGLFYGVIARDASVSHSECVILDKQSRSVTIPSLEIDQPDCRRAAHASSVGPIDPAQLFYLESRGITPDEARKFITLGFLEPVVARVPLEAEQERLWGILEAKWADSLDAAAPAA